MDELIDLMGKTLALFSRGEAQQPVRSVVPVATAGGFMGTMPAHVAGALGVKIVTFFPRNVGLHTHLATIHLFRPETGEPLASMDGRLITEMRTAAVSAVATQLLARADANVLSILGSGVQARSHLEALRLVRSFRDVRVWSPHNAGAFARAWGVRACAGAEEAVQGADVVVTATSSTTPVLRGSWLVPGAHVNAIGACRPDWRELDDELLGRARIIVDSREGALRESGDVMAAGGGRIAGELGEVVLGRVPGRTSAGELTVFKSLGMAVEDVATAKLVYDRLTTLHRP